MTKDKLSTSIFRTLTSLAENLGQLHLLLEEEQSALTRASSNDIEKFTREKLYLTRLIETGEQQRQAICTELQITPDLAGLQQLNLEISPRAGKQLTNLWHQITKLGNECATQNQLNGILLNHQQKRTLRALSALRSIVETDQIYSDKGATEIREYQSSLGHV